MAQRLSPEQAALLVPEPFEHAPRLLIAPPTRILPDLYLGDHGASINYKTLVKLGITHVLNVKGGYRSPPQPFASQLTIRSVPMCDFGTSDVRASLLECAAFVEEARQAGGACLVHCSQGQNRSPTIVLALLITDPLTRWSLRAAWTYVKRRRPMVSPLLIYFQQLRMLEAAEHRLTEPTISAAEATIHIPGREAAMSSAAQAAEEWDDTVVASEMSTCVESVCDWVRLWWRGAVHPERVRWSAVAY